VILWTGANDISKNNTKEPATGAMWNCTPIPHTSS
jgi:hypothetical protein